MEKLDLEFPEYGFRKHKGYGTKEHLERVRDFGLSPYHRVGPTGKSAVSWGISLRVRGTTGESPH